MKVRTAPWKHLCLSVDNSWYSITNLPPNI